MEIVKKEIIKNVSEYKYYGFLCYLLKNSDEVRNMLLKDILTFYDIDSSELSNEEIFEEGTAIGYDLKIVEKNGNIEEFEFDVINDTDELVVFLKICTKDKKVMDDIDLRLQFNFYILCDDYGDIFNKFVIKDTGLRKHIAFNPCNLSTIEDNFMDFHFTVSLDHIDEVEINSSFKELMYLLKYNKPYDDNSCLYKLIDSLHEKYLNSERYALDLEYELCEARKRALNRN